MPECARCGRFTDTNRSGRYLYRTSCQKKFSEIERNGIVVEGQKGGYNITVTGDVDTSVGSGKEYSQVEALARGKKLSEETGLQAMFKYEGTGSKWMLEAYLEQKPDIRYKVYSRLGRDPERNQGGGGLTSWLRGLFS